MGKRSNNNKKVNWTVWLEKGLQSLQCGLMWTNWGSVWDANYMYEEIGFYGLFCTPYPKVYFCNANGFFFSIFGKPKNWVGAFLVFGRTCSGTVGRMYRELIFLLLANGNRVRIYFVSVDFKSFLSFF